MPKKLCCCYYMVISVGYRSIIDFDAIQTPISIVGKIEAFVQWKHKKHGGAGGCREKHVRYGLSKVFFRYDIPTLLNLLHRSSQCLGVKCSISEKTYFRYFVYSQCFGFMHLGYCENSNYFDILHRGYCQYLVVNIWGPDTAGTHSTRSI